ncbi:TPA: hypothetical protein L5995_02850 [Pseudomonas aeruginosa]|nr:hypothetical protein [Pseudomonas aeruginosa]HBP6242312.1 hypothetical protein [Pseudomonas aeruginosa]
MHCRRSGGKSPDALICAEGTSLHVRAASGNSRHFGLVGITGLPFAGFVDTVRRSNLAALSRLSAMASSMPAVEPPPPREDSAGS